jgi:hypothetical protein
MPQAFNTLQKPQQRGPKNLVGTSRPRASSHQPAWRRHDVSPGRRRPVVQKNVRRQADCFRRGPAWSCPGSYGDGPSRPGPECDPPGHPVERVSRDTEGEARSVRPMVDESFSSGRSLKSGFGLHILHIVHGVGGCRGPSKPEIVTESFSTFLSFSSQTVPE